MAPALAPLLRKIPKSTQLVGWGAQSSPPYKWWGGRDGGYHLAVLQVLPCTALSPASFLPCAPIFNPSEPPTIPLYFKDPKQEPNAGAGLPLGAAGSSATAWGGALHPAAPSFH